MQYSTTIGIDVSDRTSKVCVMGRDSDGRRVILEEATVKTTRDGFRSFLAPRDRSVPVTFETGTHARWMRREIGGMGFHVYVANPAKLPTVTGSATKNDRNDARELARLTLADPELLHPVKLRDEPYQRMLQLLTARDALVATRTKVVNMMRGFAKARGIRLPDCSADRLHEADRSEWPADFESLTYPLRRLLESVAVQIRAYDGLVRDLSRTEPFRAMTGRVREVYGVGALIAAAFVAVIGGDVSRFPRARDVGAYLGLVPRQDQSGTIDRQLHVTKAGNQFMRRLLVEGANVVLQSNARDTDLKARGLRICLRGGKIAKAKAKVAVARGLAVTMLALLMKPEAEYVPLSEFGRRELERIRAEEERRAMAR